MTTYNNSINNTTASITFIGDTGIIGITDGSAAPTGSVGELITVDVSSPVSLTTATNANITSINLTAGDWDVWGNISFSGSASNVSQAYGWINNVSITQPDPSLMNNMNCNTTFSVFTCVVSPYRYSSSSSQTVYLSCQAVFATGTCTAIGYIMARRRR